MTANVDGTASAGATALTVSGWQGYWRNELGARGLRPATIVYRMKVQERFTKFYDGTPEDLTSAHLLQWRESMVAEGLAVLTVNGYLASVRTFLNWLVEEGVLERAPRVRLLSERNEVAPAVYNSQELSGLSKGAAAPRQGRSGFEAIRDAAVIALLQDSGLRASECAGLLLENLNLPARQVFVHGEVAKGGKTRTVTFGFQAAKLLNKYVMARRKHGYEFMPELFLGRQGPASYPLIRRIVRAAGNRAGIAGARPHLLRHSWAHNMKDAGVDMETLMSLGGWTSTEMPMRYGRSGREERAVKAYQRLGSPIDNRRRAG